MSGAESQRQYGKYEKCSSKISYICLSASSNANLDKGSPPCQQNPCSKGLLSRFDQRLLMNNTTGSLSGTKWHITILKDGLKIFQHFVFTDRRADLSKSDSSKIMIYNSLWPTITRPWVSSPFLYIKSFLSVIFRSQCHFWSLCLHRILRKKSNNHKRTNVLTPLQL